MIVITAATGKIGTLLVQDLLGRGEKVRAVARDPQKLNSLKGAEAFAADVKDAAAMANAFAGADAVFTLVPPDYGASDVRASQNKVGDVYAAAVKAAGVKHVVNLSSLGAELPGKTGPIAGLHDNEQKLNALPDVNVLHLRPTYFMENLFVNLGLIKGQGINGSPMVPDVPLPMIATRDIAKAAAERLAKRDFKGHSVQELLGPRDVTMKEVTAVLGKAIGKPDLPYVQFAYADAEKAMAGMGLSADTARLFVEMYKAFNDRIIRPQSGRTAQNSTPTTLEEFAQWFAAAYKEN